MKAVILVLSALLLVSGALAASMPPPFTRVLSFQSPPMKGNDVTILQNLILRSPYVSGSGVTTNGIYDSFTEAAVSDFQKGNHIAVTQGYGVFDSVTANTLLTLHSCDGYIDSGAPASSYGNYKYKIYIQIVNNRSIETNAILLDANNTLLHKFRVRTHGYDTFNQNAPWPSYSNTVGLNMFSSNGATPTGLIECDLNSPEPNATLYGPFPINRAVVGLKGNAQFLMTHTGSIRNGILLHTGLWPNWNPTMDMPNSEGCIHAHPVDIATIWQILTKKLGVVVNENPFGEQPYPFTPQGILSIEQVGCQ